MNEAAFEEFQSNPQSGQIAEISLGVNAPAAIAKQENPQSGRVAEISLNCNSRLNLTDESIAYLVCDGSVSVYELRQGDDTVLSRRSIATCNAGEFVFPAEWFHERTSCKHTIQIIGLSDSVIRPIQMANLWLGIAQEIALASRIDSASAMYKLHRWTRLINAAIGDLCPVLSTERIDKLGVINIAEGQRIRVSDTFVRWLKVTKGALSIGGHTEVKVAVNDTWLPTSAAVWYVALEPTEFEIRPIQNAKGLRLAESLHLFHSLLFQAIEVARARTGASELERLRNLVDHEVADTSQALEDFAHAALHSSRSAKCGTPLLTALAEVSRELRIRFKPPQKSEDMRRVVDPLEAIARASGVRIRKVALQSDWWKQDVGNLICTIDDDKRPVALIRKRRLWGLFASYIVVDPALNGEYPMNAELNKRLSNEATEFVRPLPSGKFSQNFMALIRFSSQMFILELVLLFVLSLAATFVGMSVPMATRIVIDNAIPDASTGRMIELAIILSAATLSQAVVGLARSLIILRTKTAATWSIQAAVFDRLLRLRSSFFGKYQAGDLMFRATMVTEVSNGISGIALQVLLSSFAAFFNLGLCFYYSSTLAWIAVVVAIATFSFNWGLAYLVRSRSRKAGEIGGKMFSFTYQLVTGITKLRLGAAEQRALNVWTRRFADQIRLTTEVQFLQNTGVLINNLFTLVSTICLFYFASVMLQEQQQMQLLTPLLTMGTFLAFRSAFDSTLGGATDLSDTMLEITETWVRKDMMKPILEEPPEVDDNKIDPGRLEGGVELRGIDFRYGSGGPMVLDGVSLYANPGEFIAIVGPSGCGKSTLFKLLLGFETPTSGSVLYDGQNLAGLNVNAVRRQIGTVLQNGKINSGSIFEAIGAGVNITMDEAWEAVRDAGFEKDVKEMPMGMHTLMSEGATTLSGGQRQRLLIARALATNPKLLLLDEATSALDNRTQEIVSDSVRKRRVTRIVIAHRLSTIRDADRIYVIEKGKVSQRGTFEELKGQPGLFARLIDRQKA